MNNPQISEFVPEDKIQRVLAVVAFLALLIFFIRLPLLDGITVGAGAVGAVLMMIGMGRHLVRNIVSHEGPITGGNVGALLSRYRFIIGIVFVSGAALMFSRFYQNWGVWWQALVMALFFALIVAAVALICCQIYELYRVASQKTKTFVGALWIAVAGLSILKPGISVLFISTALVITWPLLSGPFGRGHKQ